MYSEKKLLSFAKIEARSYRLEKKQEWISCLGCRSSCIRHTLVDRWLLLLFRGEISGPNCPMPASMNENIVFVLLLGNPINRISLPRRGRWDSVTFCCDRTQHGRHKEEELGFLLIDTRYALNEISRTVMLWVIRHERMQMMDQLPDICKHPRAVWATSATRSQVRRLPSIVKEHPSCCTPQYRTS